jgi:sulfate adenylyltransferase
LTDTTKTVLISPCGGNLVNLCADPEEVQDLRAQAERLPSIQLSARSVCDLEMLATGAFSPLDCFMKKRDYLRVLEESRLADGHLFPIPVTLPIEANSEIRIDQRVALRDAGNNLLALITVEEIYEWDWQQEAEMVLGATDLRHPFVAEIRHWGRFNISGQLQIIQLPLHYDFKELRLSPAETRSQLAQFGRQNIVAFQTRNPLHRAHEELTKRAIEKTDGVLLLQPVVGLTKIGDVDHYTRVRTYKILTERYYYSKRVLLGLLPLAMRMAGPREALWHALIRRNYGANHFIVGRDHASPGMNSAGLPFYGPYDAQHLVERFSEELEIKVLPFQELVYLPEEDRYEEVGNVPHGVRSYSISGSEIRNDYLNKGKILPVWFTRCEVAEILAKAFPPHERRGVCIWFTGLCGAGKSTIAEILTVLLLERGRRVTFLDGDVIRTHLSKGLGFSKADRDINILRIGFVASEVVYHGGVAICATISPYEQTRNECRRTIGADSFIEVFVNTPLEICESRDTKSMYKKARSGKVKSFTGIDDPYEPPLYPEITLNTVDYSAEENARIILTYLMSREFVPMSQDNSP